MNINLSKKSKRLVFGITLAIIITATILLVRSIFIEELPDVSNTEHSIFHDVDSNILSKDKKILQPDSTEGFKRYKPKSEEYYRNIDPTRRAGDSR